MRGLSENLGVSLTFSRQVSCPCDPATRNRVFTAIQTFLEDSRVTMDEEKQLAQSSVEEVKPVRQFLATALDNKRRDKDPFFYDQVVKQLKERDDEDTLWKIYIGLATCPSFLSARLVKYLQ